MSAAATFLWFGRYFARLESMRRKAALSALLLVCATPVMRSQEPAPRDGSPVRVLSVKPLVLPWNTTRASWERTKDVATSYWRVMPIAQVATALLFVKTVLSAPYDLAAAPFRQKTRSIVAFEVRGRILDGEGKPAPNAKLLVRCTAPWGGANGGGEQDYFETGRFGPVVADSDGRVELQATSETGLDASFMVHLDLEDVSKGAASAGAYSVVLSTGGPAVTPVLTGTARLAPDTGLNSH